VLLLHPLLFAVVSHNIEVDSDFCIGGEGDVMAAAGVGGLVRLSMATSIEGALLRMQGPPKA
jgi:hypothetical protein